MTSFRRGLGKIDMTSGIIMTADDKMTLENGKKDGGKIGSYLDDETADATVAV